MTCSVCWKPDTRQCPPCSHAFCDVHYNPFCEQCSPQTAAPEAGDHKLEESMNCYICNGVSIGRCSMCKRAYCGTSVEGGLCKVCEALFLNGIGELREGEGAGGLHERMLKAAGSIGIHQEHVPTREQVDAFQARAATWQEQNSHLFEERAAAEQAMTKVTQTNLQRVVPVGQTKTIRESEMTLLSLDLYDDGIVLHWWLRAPTGHESLAEGAFRDRQNLAPAELADFMHSLFKRIVVTARDERGNAYQGGMAGVRWTESEVDDRGEARLTPAVHPGAKRLTVRIEELVISQLGGGPAILMGEDGRPFPSTATPDIGPWEFEVEL